MEMWLQAHIKLCVVQNKFVLRMKEDMIGKNKSVCV